MKVTTAATPESSPDRWMSSATAGEGRGLPGPGRIVGIQMLPHLLQEPGLAVVALAPLAPLARAAAGVAADLVLHHPGEDDGVVLEVVHQPGGEGAPGGQVDGLQAAGDVGLVEEDLQDEVLPGRDAVRPRHAGPQEEHEILLPPGLLEAFEVAAVDLAAADPPLLGLAPRVRGLVDPAMRPSFQALRPCAICARVLVSHGNPAALPPARPGPRRHPGAGPRPAAGPLVGGARTSRSSPGSPWTARSTTAGRSEIAAGDWLGSQVFFQAPLYPYLLAAPLHALRGAASTRVYLAPDRPGGRRLLGPLPRRARDGGRGGGARARRCSRPSTARSSSTTRSSSRSRRPWPSTASSSGRWPRRGRRPGLGRGSAAGALLGDPGAAAGERAARSSRSCSPSPGAAEGGGRAFLPARRRPGGGARPGLAAGGAAQRAGRRGLPPHHLPGGRELLHRQQPARRTAPTSRSSPASRSRPWSGGSRCGSPSRRWAGRLSPGEVSRYWLGKALAWARGASRRFPPPSGPQARHVLELVRVAGRGGLLLREDPLAGAPPAAPRIRRRRDPGSRGARPRPPAARPLRARPCSSPSAGWPRR